MQGTNPSTGQHALVIALYRHPSSIRHALLISLSLSSVFLFSGIIFGWAAFESLLVREGRFYTTLCAPDDPQPCEAQREALHRAFTISSTAVSVVALPAGWLVDCRGPLVGTAISGVLVLLGLAGVALSDSFGSAERDLFAASLVILSIGGAMAMFCAYAMPFLFPKRGTLLISATSCLFDASCAIFPALHVLYDLGVSFQALLWGLASVALANFSLLCGAWWLCRAELAASRKNSLFDAPAEGAQGAQGAPPPLLSSRPLHQQLYSLEFLCIMLYSALQVMRSNLYLGTVGMTTYSIVGSGAEVDKALLLIGLIVPLGFLVIPLIDGCIHRIGLLGALHVTSVLGFAYNTLQLLPNLGAQLLAAAFFAIFRAFLFSIISAYNMAIFGPLTMGRVMGLCFIVAAMVNLTQVPLVNMSLYTFEGDCRPMLLIVLLASVPLSLVWLILQCKQKPPPSAREEPLLPASPKRRPSTSGVVAPWGGPALRTSELNRSSAGEA
ncbi:hypothetical protein AB1Y20_012126 [Prymnesium parvum]|uniref:Solute carrier family 40 protein n=1 Tax=Prymnesium parvum TaxID=97485 RepID=A0AB34IQW4_PRYPA